MSSVREKALQKRMSLQELIEYAKSLEQTKKQGLELESHMPANVHKESRAALKLPGMKVKEDAVSSGIGHTQAACRKKLKVWSATVKQLWEDDEYVDQLADDDVHDMFHVHRLGGPREQPILSVMQVNNQTLQFEVDTIASITFMSLRQFKQLWPSLKPQH
ncbi:hypothetical protein SK128_000155 [Halocaridina rubra]|uniref:Uncharacterized protein n=1 Tax=Halocaridina rubra TaxID=373956 RepID=A0AAN9A1D3_HALRR